MDVFDIIVIVAALFAAIGGYRLGFLARVLSWVGLAAGLVVSAHYLPRIIKAVNLSSSVERLAVAAGILVAAAFIGQGIGLMVGSRLHGVLPLGPLRQVDRGIGAAVGVAGVFAAVWLLLPSISSVPGWPARTTRNSVIAQWVGRRFPPPPDTVEALRRLVGVDAFPQVFSALRPGGAVGPPPAASPLPATLAERVAQSTVKVEGQACNRIQDGSGFAVAHDLVLTNAHVVAGEPAGKTFVLLPSGGRRAATVVLFDPNRDIALLAVSHLGESPLPLGKGAVGERGDVFGHPGGQTALAIQPASIAQEITAVGKGLYGKQVVRRDVYVLASSLAPGDSGGALVNTGGDVVGVAFAIAIDHPHTAYALTTKVIEADLTAPRSGAAVSTRACLAD